MYDYYIYIYMDMDHLVDILGTHLLKEECQIKTMP